MNKKIQYANHAGKPMQYSNQTGAACSTATCVPIVTTPPAAVTATTTPMPVPSNDASWNRKSGTHHNPNWGGWGNNYFQSNELHNGVNNILNCGWGNNCPWTLPALPMSCTVASGETNCGTTVCAPAAICAVPPMTNQQAITSTFSNTNPVVCATPVTCTPSSTVPPVAAPMPTLPYQRPNFFQWFGNFITGKPTHASFTGHYANATGKKMTYAHQTGNGC